MNYAIPSNETTSSSKLSISISIIVLAASCILMSDMYAPSMPHIASSLNAPSHLVKLSISLYLVGMLVSQLILGPVSDAYGRRPVIIFGLTIATLGSYIAISAHSIFTLNLARCTQGFGAGAIALNARAMARDRFSQNELIKIYALIGTAISIAPAIAPLIGGYLQHNFGWKAVFFTMFFWFTLLTGVIFKWLPETNFKANKEISIQKTLNNYKQLFQIQSFTSYAFVGALSFSIIILYFTATPHLLQEHMHLSVLEYSWSCVLAISTMIISRVLNLYLLNYFTQRVTSAMGITIALTSALALSITAAMRATTACNFIVLATIMMLGIGFVVSNVMAQAFQDVKDMAGAAGAVYGGIQMACSSLISCISAHLPPDNVLSFSLSAAVVCSFTLAILIRRAN